MLSRQLTPIRGRAAPVDSCGTRANLRLDCRRRRAVARRARAHPVRLGQPHRRCGDHLRHPRSADPRYPDCRVTIACGPAAAGVYARMPQLERTIIFQKHKNDSHWPKLWRQVAFTVWGLVIDIRGSALGLPHTRPANGSCGGPGRAACRAARGDARHPPAPLPVVWTAPAGPGVRRRAAAAGPASHRLRRHGELGAQGLARRPVRRPCPRSRRASCRGRAGVFAGRGQPSGRWRRRCSNPTRPSISAAS